MHNNVLTFCKIEHVNLKDHNELEKVARRGGRKMPPPTEFVSLKASDGEGGIFHPWFDRYFTLKWKQELLSLTGKVVIIRVNKNEGGMLTGQKFRVLW